MGVLTRYVITVFLFILIATASAHAETLNVPEDYPTIQEAVDAAQAGDTVHVAAGEYRESIIIEKPLDKAEALCVAQRKVMKTTGCTHPWYWAAFDTMGDWR